MPSQTFHNLPAEKRENLLRAAVAEFSRVPYPEASINKMVQAAGISRGSFYMYFKDKEDLFLYLLGEYKGRLIAIVENMLEAEGGDPFAAFLAMFDFIQRDYRDPERAREYENIISVLRVNRDLGQNVMVGLRSKPPFLALLSARVDGNLLSLEGDGDLEDILHILIGATGPAIISGILTDDPGPARAKYVNVLSILRRGMGKKQPAAIAQ